MDLAIFSMDNPLTPLATNKFTPKGGVQKPIAKLTVKITPNKIGSTPILDTTGSKIGVNMIMEAIVSINMPTNNKKILIINRITIGLSEIFTKKFANFAGTCCKVSNRPKVEAKATNIKTVPEVKEDFMNVSNTSFIFISL